MEDKTYLCIDLKTFYASVECVERGLDPFTTKLAVADPDRESTTICLAISPRMKELGVHNRCRLFEIPKDISYIMAKPRMKKYIEYSANIYAIYLKYISKEDIYVYSIDECFMDVTSYLNMYQISAFDLAKRIIDDVYKTYGITATAGIGTNLYLCKIALDINAKHAPDFIGVLDEESYREKLWDHKPLSDFWRIGRGIESRLSRFGIFTMRQIAHAPEDLLYKEFGIDAELLIDHAWGRESVTMRDIQAYKPKNNSICSGQVLFKDYPFDEALVVVKEMGDDIALQLSRKKKKAAGITLGVGMAGRSGGCGRHMSYSFPSPTQNDLAFRDIAARLFVSMVGKDEYVRRFMISLSGIVDDNDPVQLDLFLDNE